MKIREMKEQRQQLHDKMDALLYTGEGAARSAKASLTEDEETQYRDLEKQFDALDAQIKRLDAAEARSAAAAKPASQYAGGEEGEIARIAKRFSFVRAGSLLMQHKKFDGAEGEVDAMARDEAKRSNDVAVGGFGIPSYLMRICKQDGTEMRTTLDVATEGGDLVQTDIMSDIIPVLRPTILSGTLGVRVLTGLTSNVKQPKNTTGTTAEWEGENDANAETVPVFGALDLSPNRLAAKAPISRQLLLQANPAMENFVRMDLENALAYKIDLATLYDGPASDNSGIFKFLGTGETVSNGANGGVPTYAKVLDCIKLIETANAAGLGPISVLATPGLKALLKTVKIDSGSGRMVWEGTEVDGITAYSTNFMPSNLNKGTTTSNSLHAFLVGAFNQAILAQFGPLDMILDELTGFDNNIVYLKVNSYWDVNVRHAAAFAKMADCALA